MDEKLREKCRLRSKEIRASHPYWEYLSDNAVLRVKVIANAQLDKAEPLIRQDERERIAKNVKGFLMNHYLVTSGDKYRLNHDDLKELDGILKGQALKAAEGKEG